MSFLFGGAEGNLRSLSRLAALLRTLSPFRSLPRGATAPQKPMDFGELKQSPRLFFRTLRFPSNQNKRNRTLRHDFFYFGGAEGNRTPVRKPIHGAFYERSPSLGFPFCIADGQAMQNGSFISSWKGSKLCPTHVHR